MKPLTIMFEFESEGVDAGNKIQWKPRKFKGRFKDGYFIRYWWLCLAVTFVRMSLYEYNRYVGSGATEWRFQ